jgi:hypothetical protein
MAMAIPATISVGAKVVWIEVISKIKTPARIRRERGKVISRLRR